MSRDLSQPDWITLLCDCFIEAINCFVWFQKHLFASIKTHRSLNMVKVKNYQPLLLDRSDLRDQDRRVPLDHPAHVQNKNFSQLTLTIGGRITVEALDPLYLWESLWSSWICLYKFDIFWLQLGLNNIWAKSSKTSTFITKILYGWSPV